MQFKCRNQELDLLDTIIFHLEKVLFLKLPEKMLFLEDS